MNRADTSAIGAATAPRRRVRSALFDRHNRFEGRGLGAGLTRLTTFFYAGAHGNLVRIGRNFRTRGLLIEVTGEGNRVEIGDDVRLSGKIGLRGNGLIVRIGDRTDAKRTRIVACEADVTIGSDCLIAAGVRLRSSDMHAIRERETGSLLNPPEPVIVGDRVWLAAEVALMKGARVADGCVVGFRSVVTDSFDEPDCVIVGSPARVVRRGVVWSR